MGTVKGSRYPILFRKLLIISGKRVEGIEPSCPAWEAVVLPLNYTRRGLFPRIHCSAVGRVGVPDGYFFA